MRPTKTRRVICALPILTALLAAAVAPARGESRGEPPSLERKIQAVLGDSSLKKASVGIDVVALDTGAALAALETLRRETA